MTAILFPIQQMLLELLPLDSLAPLFFSFLYFYNEKTKSAIRTVRLPLGCCTRGTHSSGRATLSGGIHPRSDLASLTVARPPQGFIPPADRQILSNPLYKQVLVMGQGRLLHPLGISLVTKSNIEYREITRAAETTPVPDRYFGDPKPKPVAKRVGAVV